MKVLVKYDEQFYLVDGDKSKTEMFKEVWSIHSNGKWPDECHDLSWVEQRAQIICYLNDEAELVEGNNYG